MRRIGKIKYTPMPVRDALVQMKDLSELMIDLAYSAALLNDRVLAEEVIELEERVDTLVYILNMNLMFSARDKEDAEALAGVAKVGSMANKISDAAADIADIVLYDIGIHPIVREVFRQTEEHLSSIEVRTGASIEGKTVEELHLTTRIGVDVIAIRRGRHWLINPVREAIMPGDVIVARGTTSGLETLSKTAGWDH